jgi:predicted aminopeptidase
MAMMGVGAELAEFRTLFVPRVTELEEQYIAPLDESSRAVAEAERALEAARQRHRDLTGDRWSAYRPDYERTLNAEPPAADEQPDAEQPDQQHSDDSAESAEEVTS